MASKKINHFVKQYKQIHTTKKEEENKVMGI